MPLKFIWNNIKKTVKKINKNQIMENKKIYLERLFNADVKKVWSALTDKNEMQLWYFDLKEFQPEVGLYFNLPVAHHRKNNICIFAK